MSAQLSGLGWLSDLAQAYRDLARQGQGQVQNPVQGYLDQVTEDAAGRRVGMFSGPGEQGVGREVRAHLKFARGVRAEIVAQVRLQAGLDAAEA